MFMGFFVEFAAAGWVYGVILEYQIGDELSADHSQCIIISEQHNDPSIIDGLQ